MESQEQEREIILVENRAEKFNWGFCCRNADPSNSISVTLYDSQKDKLNLAASNSTTNHIKNQTTLSSIEQIFNTASGQNTIKLLSTFHHHLKSHKLSTQVLLEDSVLKSLHGIWKTLNITVKVTVSEGLQTTFEIPLNDMTIPRAESTLQVFPQQQYPNAKFDNLTYSVMLQFQNEVKISRSEAVLRHLFEEKLLADCCILTADKTEIKCHASVLAANSDVFHTMLTSGLQESQTNTIEMTDLSETVVNTLLSYLYGLEIDTSQIEADMAFDLLRVAHKYNLAYLEKDMLETLLFKPEDSLGINTVLVMYFFTEKIEDFKELSEKFLHILRKNPKELQVSSAYQELLETDPKEAANLAFKLLELGST